MKAVGALLALAVLVLIVLGIGYAAVAGYELLKVNWRILAPESRAILFVVAAMLLSVTLITTYTLSRVIDRESARSVGRTDAYNAFVSWYSMLHNSGDNLPDAASLAPIKNRMVLWGGGRVVKQLNQLYDQLMEKEIDNEAVIKKAGHVYLEIKRELGHRSPGVDRSIV